MSDFMGYGFKHINTFEIERLPTTKTIYIMASK